MTLDERILHFLDGSLPNEDEAELLHTLSVSPEKRGVLRGFMEQNSLLARDSKALRAPASAEERLWERIDAVMPAPASSADPSFVPMPVESNAGTIASHSFRGLSRMISALTLLTGLGIGYFAGARSAPVQTRIVKVVVPAPALATTRPAASESSLPARRGLATWSLLAAPNETTDLPATAPKGHLPSTSEQHAEVALRPEIASLPPQVAPPITPQNRIGGNGGGIKPIFHSLSAVRGPQQSLLQRFELRVDESFGRQFPNNTATNVSWPLITNSSISALFQLLPHSNLVWLGGGYGSASVTTKELSVAQGDPSSPYIPLSQDVLQADTVHKETTYFAAMAELRFPAFAATDLTLGGGYGWASLGRMLFAELGFHYYLSEQVGTQIGLRVMRFTYDLGAEKQAAIESAPGGLAISNAVASVGPSFNTELNAGLFFNF